MKSNKKQIKSNLDFIKNSESLYAVYDYNGVNKRDIDIDNALLYNTGIGKTFTEKCNHIVLERKRENQKHFYIMLIQ